MPMDVGYLGKGKSKGQESKGKGKGKAEKIWHLQPPSCRNGSKDRAGKSGGKGKDAKKFEGYCSNPKCGKWGHKWKDCRAEGGGGAYKHKGSVNDLEITSPEWTQDASGWWSQGAAEGNGDCSAVLESEGDWVFMINDTEQTITLSKHAFGCGLVQSVEKFTGRDGKKVDIMVDSGTSETVCGPTDFPDSPIQEGPRMKLRTASGQELKYYGIKVVKLKTMHGEEMQITFTVVDVVRPLLSVSKVNQQGTDAHFSRDHTGSPPPGGYFN